MTLHPSKEIRNRHLLRASCRESGKVKHKTIANLSACSDDEINAVKPALKHKHHLDSLVSVTDIQTSLDKRIGAVWLFSVAAGQIGITKVQIPGFKAGRLWPRRSSGLKGPQIDEPPDDFRYITAITRPQVLKMLEARVIQDELFTEKLCEARYCDLENLERAF